MSYLSVALRVTFIKNETFSLFEITVYFLLMLDFGAKYPIINRIIHDRRIGKTLHIPYIYTR